MIDDKLQKIANWFRKKHVLGKHGSTKSYFYLEVCAKTNALSPTLYLIRNQVSSKLTFISMNYFITLYTRKLHHICKRSCHFVYDINNIANITFLETNVDTCKCSKTSLAKVRVENTCKTKV